MTTDTLGSNAQAKLRSLVDRIERLEEDKAGIAGDLKEVYAEAKGEGFDTKIIRKVIRLRAIDKAKRDEEASLVDLYMHAVQGDLFEGTVTMQVGDRDPVDITAALNRQRAGR